MMFEVRYALTHLDERTPPFFLQEIFAHGNLQVKVESLKVLRDIDPEKKTVRILREMLKIT